MEGAEAAGHSDEYEQAIGVGGERVAEMTVDKFGS